MTAARLLCLLLAAGCGDDTMLMEAADLSMPAIRDMAMLSTGDAATSASVDVVDNAYAPRNVIITQGGTVTWTWRASNQHTVTADDGSFDSSPAKSSGTFSHTFLTPGNFPYHCLVHGPLMAGTITVQ